MDRQPWLEFVRLVISSLERALRASDKRKIADMANSSKAVVGICGLEPQTSSLSVTRSNQLSYIPIASPPHSTKNPPFLQDSPQDEL